METRLKVFRAMRDITQEDLAKAVGVLRQTVIAKREATTTPPGAGVQDS